MSARLTMPALLLRIKANSNQVRWPQIVDDRRHSLKHPYAKSTYWQVNDLIDPISGVSSLLSWA
jgi:hypothetical protein